MAGEVVQAQRAEVAQVQTSETAAVLSMIERAARDPNVDIDKMERLFLMQERMLERQAKMAFDAALADMQPKLPIIGRKGKIEIRAKDKEGNRNGEVQQATPYALWEDINEGIRPCLQEHGFALSFRTGMTPEGRVTVTGILSHRLGHREETTMTLQHDSTGSKNAVQAIGSSMSYGKRYTAIALLNITSRGEDDDGGKGGDQSRYITADQVQELEVLLSHTKSNLAGFLKLCKIDRLEDMPAEKFEGARGRLIAKRDAQS